MPRGGAKGQNLGLLKCIFYKCVLEQTDSLSDMAPPLDYYVVMKCSSACDLYLTVE